MTDAAKFADYAPTPEAAVIVDETLDNFRHRAKAIPSIRVGGAKFYKRTDLLAWKKQRDAARKRA